MTPAFKAKKIRSETLGEYLKDTRATLKLTILQVHRLTQIPEKFLKNLEEGEYENLPDDVYVRGFLQSLSGVYKVPAKSLLAQFAAERGVDRHLTNDPLIPRSVRPFFIPRFVITPKTFGIFTVVVLVLASVGYLVWQVSSVSAAPDLEIFYPESDVTVASRSILLRGKAEAGSKLFINNQPVLVAEDGEFTEVLNLTEGANNILIRAENKFGKSTEVTRSVVVNSGESVPVGNAISENATTTREVLASVIRVMITIGPESAVLKIESDGQVVQDGQLPAGTKVSFGAEDLMVIFTSNAGSTRLEYNGQDLGVLGKSGESLSNIKFTP